MTTDSLITGEATEPEDTNATEDVTSTEANAGTPTSNENDYQFDFKGQDIQTGAEVDITKDPVYEKLVPTFKELGLTQDQAQAMLTGYMNKTYNAVDGLGDDDGMIFGKYKDAVAAQDAFKTLESENGRLRRAKQPEAPDEYKYDFAKDEDLKDILPEDFDFAEDPLVKHMEPIFKEGHFTQDQVAAATKAWLTFQADQRVDSKAELEALGTDGKDIIAGVQSFRDNGGFSDEEKQIIESWAGTGNELKLLSKMRSMMTQQKKIPTGDRLQAPLKTSSELYAEASALRREPNFQNDRDAQKVYETKMDAAVTAEGKGY